MKPLSRRARARALPHLQTLALQRPMTSLMERELIAASEAFVYDKTDWVRLWMDPGHLVSSDCGTMQAHRAITVSGQLLWYVFTNGKSRGYHAQLDDPFAAMQEARDVAAARRAVRARWDEIESLARDLRRGRARLDVTLEDAHASPLCTLGIEGFCASVGLADVPRISGRTAACLMLIEPQLGFVIDAAWQRQRSAQGMAGMVDAAISGDAKPV